MNYSSWLTRISDRANVSQAFFEVLQDANKVQVEIKNIDSEKGAINIELLQFVSTYPVYQKLEEERTAIINEFNQTEDYKKAREIFGRLEKKSNEQKEFVKAILMSAHAFTEVRPTKGIEAAAEQFFLGNIQSAHQQLKPTEIKSKQDKYLEYTKLNLELRKAYLGLEDNANEFKIKGQLTMLNYKLTNSEDRFQKALFYFERGKISAEKTIHKNFTTSYLFSFAYFLQNHNEINRAEPLYLEALELSRKLVADHPTTHLPNLGLTLSNLGQLQYSKYEFEKAEKCYEEALAIFRQFESRYLPEVAMVLDGWGNLLRSKNEFKKARKLGEEALEIYRELARDNSQAYLPRLAGSLNSLGVLNSDMGDFFNASKLYREALEIYRKLEKENITNYEFHSALLLNNMAIDHAQVKKYKIAEKCFRRALETRRELAKANPHTNLGYVADTINNFANLMINKGEIESAKTLYLEALIIRKKLTALKPQLYEIPLADTNFELSSLYRYDLPDEILSIKYAREAISLYQKYENTAPHAMEFKKFAEDNINFWKDTTANKS